MQYKTFWKRSTALSSLGNDGFHHQLTVAYVSPYPPPVFPRGEGTATRRLNLSSIERNWCQV